MEIIKVDAMGLACPLPVVKTIEALKTLTAPATIETHVDNAVAVQNVMRLAEGKGLPVHTEKISDDHYVITINADPASHGKTPDAPLSCIPDKRGHTVIAVTSDAMGHGSDELGKQLMKGFLYAVSQQEELPKAILFYNGGAKLTTEGSLSLEDIRNLEAQGVEILTCGTCLNYYGLSDKLMVGSVTNMYSIVETLAGAYKVIKP